MEHRPESSSGTPRSVRWLLQAAMGIFVVTVVIGILNGLDLVEFPRNALLTHLHSGTLGWITLGVFAAAFSMYATEPTSVPGWLPGAAIVAAVAYVTAFYTTVGVLRPLAGSTMFLVIVGVFTWVVRQVRRVPTFSIAHLALLAGLVNLVIGAVLGVLLGFQLAGRISWLPAGAFLAHGSAMVAGYVILAAMGIIEWKLVDQRRPIGRDRWGIAQVGLLFLAGLILAVGALLDRIELITLNVPLMVVGAVIFLGRVGRSALKPNWTVPGSGRAYSIGVLFLVVNISLLAYLISQLVAAQGDVNQIPLGVVLAMDHALFVGVMVNVVFGLIYAATEPRKALWPWVDRLMFWGINIGLAGFLAGLIAESPALKRVFTPLMGASILLAILAHSLRMNSLPSNPPEAAMEVAKP